MPNGEKGENEEKEKVSPQEKAKKLKWLNPNSEKKEPNGLGDRTNFLVSGVISLILAVLVVFLMAPLKGDFQDLSTELTTQFSTLSSQIDTKFASYQGSVTNQISSYNSRVSGLEGKVGTLESGISRLTGLESKVNTAISGIEAEIAAGVQAHIAKLDARILVLEAEKEEEEEEEVVSEDTRWSFRTPSIYGTATNLGQLVLDLDYSRIKEEDLYEVELYIHNPGPSSVDLVNAELELVLSPREYIGIDEDDTYLDSDDAPFLDWDVDFVMKTREGEEVCRRIIFTSAKKSLGLLAVGDTLRLDLILELYYGG